MTEPTRVTCRGICSRPISYELEGELYVSYIYRLEEGTEIRYRSRSEDFILEHSHNIQLAFPFTNPGDDFSGSFDSNRWNIRTTGASFGFQNDGFYTQVVGLDGTRSDLFPGTSLDTLKWTKTDVGEFLTIDDSLRLVHPSGVASAISYIDTVGKSYFTEDFDVHLYVDGTQIGQASTGDQYLRLEMDTISGLMKYYVGYYVDAAGARTWQSDYYKEGVWQSEVTAVAAASGYVRAARSSNTVTTYYSTDRENWSSIQAFDIPPVSGSLTTKIEALMRAEAYDGYMAYGDNYSVVDNSSPQSYYLETTWKLLGSFDIVIPYQISFWEAENTSEFTVSIIDDLRKNFSFSIGRRKTSSNEDIVGYYVAETGREDASSIGIIDPTGNLRITRSGELLTSYYWDSGGWVEVQSVEGYDSPVKVRIQTSNSDNNPIAEVAVGGLIVASGNAQWIDPEVYDIDIRDNGDLELVFVMSNRMFHAIQNHQAGQFTTPQGLIIYQDEGSRIAQAYDAAVTHSSSNAILSYIDENKYIKYAKRRANTNDPWIYPEFQYSTVESSGDPMSIDADYSYADAMFSITWDSLAGYDDYDILYTKFGLLEGQAASGVLAVAKVGMWNPKVECGYFYFENREYYLYANKQVIESDASSGSFTINDFSKDRMLLGPPIVITSASGYILDDAMATPFARTWYQPYGSGRSDPTPTKYRRRFNLSDRKETKQSASGIIEYSFQLGEEYPREFYIDWGDLQDDGFYDPTFHIYDSAGLGNVIVEYEAWDASGWYTPDHIDLNPLHTPNTVNKFVILREEEPEAHEVFLDVMNPYILGPSGVTRVTATVMDHFGTPVQGETVTFSMEPYKDTDPTLFGALGATSMITSFDGSCSVTYTAPGTLSGIRGSIAGGVHIIGSINNGVTSDAAKIELGNSY